MDGEGVVRFGIFIFVLAYSCVLHECAHVWVALKLGDPTGKMEGRLTLNPLPHIDVFWTILLPSLTYFFAGLPIGGPKPAPVNPLNFRNPRTGSVITSLAGPASNLALAILGFVLFWLVFRVAPDFLFEEIREIRNEGTPLEQTFLSFRPTWNALFFLNLMLTNLALMAFNLIPLPPLDGSRFLEFILGRRGEELFAKLQLLGILPLLVAAYFLAPYAIRPFAAGLITLLAEVFGFDYAIPLINAYFPKR